MRPSALLPASCQSDWDAATDHAFCRELADGSLPLEKMKWYLVQDYKFVDQFVRLLATTIAHAPSLADAVPAAQFLALVTGPENTYFLRSFEALEVSEAEQNALAAAPTSGFQDLMQEARVSGRYEQMLAVLLAAEWSYLTWGERYVEYDEALPFWFAEWVDLHSGAGFESVVEYLRVQLDKAWLTLDLQEKSAATQMFQRTMAFERDFFNAAYAAQ
jgi:thiaminase/transcriptional activator TenA